MPSFKRPIGASGVVLAMALVAAACGSGSADTTDAGSSTEPEATPAESSAAPADGDDADSAEPEADEAEPEAAGSEEAEAEGPSPVGPHSFPDLDTVTISDGAPINLADELAGGDTPVLLWFFAPH